jgi:protein-disulfide isomerase
MIGRRTFLGGLAVGLGAGVTRSFAQDVGQWYPLVGDHGRPVANTRLPVELTSEVDDLPGAIWLGAGSRALTLVEFFDYNCPYCRAAVPDVQVLLEAKPDLRLGLVNNPILSPKSLEAAKVELALSLLGRPASVYGFHRRLFERKGTIDGMKALEVAEALGAPRAKVEELAAGPDVQGMLSEQMRLAASLGLAATPSFLIAGTGVLGYPGPNALRDIVDAVRRCDRISC